MGGSNSHGCARSRCGSSTGLSREVPARETIRESGEWFDLPETRQDRIGPRSGTDQVRGPKPRPHLAGLRTPSGGEVREFPAEANRPHRPAQGRGPTCGAGRRGSSTRSVSPVIGRMDDVVKEEGMVRLVP